MAILNILNLVAYLGNILITFGFQTLSRFPDNAELSAKYQTLVTPAGYAFSIWGIIFLVQLIWSIVQLTSKYKSSPLVDNNDDNGQATGTGVGYLYVAVCIFQCLWTIIFSIEQIPLSLVAMLSILVSLVLIVERQQHSSASLTEYWLLKFPFDIHCGWIWAASLVNFNVVLVAANLSAATQTKFAWVSLLLAVPIIAVYYLWKQVWTVPLVLAWASYAITNELSNPRDSITNKFSDVTIGRLQNASKWLAFGLLAFTAVAIILVSGNLSSNVSNWILIGVLGLTVIICFRQQRNRSRSRGNTAPQEQPLVSGDQQTTTSYQDEK